ncbi:MoaD/ThiS family protein [Candidatus Bathyarchaeota archaeon]|nr:MoaD/ThiS family protein [Candidatus Bathyarchaeota archaeon]
MKVRIQASPNFRKIIGELSVIELKEDAQLDDLLAKLGEKAGSERKGFIGPYKAGAAELVVLVNARSMKALNQPIKLKDGDTVTFFTPFAGG